MPRPVLPSVTAAMLTAGATALDLARQHGHNGRATAHIVFMAMLAESTWSRVRPATPHALLTRADFGADGLRTIINDDGTKHIQHI